MRFSPKTFLLIAGAQLAGCGVFQPLGPIDDRTQEHISFDSPLRYVWRQNTVRPFEGEYLPYTIGAPAAAPGIDQLFVTSAPGKLWSLSGGGGVRYVRPTQDKLLSTPAIDAHAGLVFFGTEGGHMHGYRIRDGKRIWTAKLNGIVRRAPLLTDRSIVVVTENDMVIALDKHKGNMLWRYRRENVPATSVIGHAGLVLDGTTLFTAFSDGTAIAMNTSNGEIKWQLDTGRDVVEPEEGLPLFLDIDTTPVIYKDHIIVASYEAGLYALERDSGNLLWHDARLSKVSAMVLADHGRLVMSSALYGLIVYDIEKQDFIWSTPTRGVPSEPIILDQTYVIFGESNGALRALSLNNAAEVFRLEANTGFAAAPVQANERVFAVSNAGTVFGLERRPRR